MPRPRRIDYPGAWHHVMNRGARREPIFRDSRDCQALLDAVGDAVAGCGIEVHAFALMPNHYHLLVRSPEGTLSRAMQCVGARHTAWLNKRHGWDGPVFRGRFHSRLVLRNQHLIWLLAYIHLNPLRAHLRHALWTSHPAYLGVEPPPSWLSLDVMLGRLGGPDGVRRFVADVHRGRRPYPDDLEVAEWSARHDEPEEAAIRPPGGAAIHETEVGAVLDTVCRLTESTPEILLEPARGRGANPARRFAAWALVNDTTLSYVEVGRALGMPTGQVRKLTARLRVNCPEPLASWRRAWLDGRAPQERPKMESVRA